MGISTITPRGSELRALISDIQLLHYKTSYTAPTLQCLYATCLLLRLADFPHLIMRNANQHAILSCDILVHVGHSTRCGKAMPLQEMQAPGIYQLLAHGAQAPAPVQGHASARIKGPFC